MDCQIKTQLLRLVFSKRKTSCFNFPLKKNHAFFGGGAYFCPLDHELANLGASQKNPWIPFRPTPSAIHHPFGRPASLGQRVDLRSPPRGFLDAKLCRVDDAIPRPWHRKFMILVDGNQKSGVSLTSWQYGLHIPNYLQRVCIHVRWLQYFFH